MSRFLLDTNIISDLVRHPAGAVTAAIRAAGEDAICTSIIVAAEITNAVIQDEYTHDVIVRIAEDVHAVFDAT